MPVRLRLAAMPTKKPATTAKLTVCKKPATRPSQWGKHNSKRQQLLKDARKTVRDNIAQTDRTTTLKTIRDTEEYVTLDLKEYWEVTVPEWSGNARNTNEQVPDILHV